jgi:hypothetical protein
MNIALHRWIKISLFNLLIVSALGILMRYKIAFSFPFLQQKFILHSHSHFAFSGWISQVLMTLMVAYLWKSQKNAFKDFKWLLWANLITAYGMLFSFPVQGYGAVSITFSTLNILTGYWFAIKFWRTLNHLLKEHSHNWFKASLVFNVISSFGAFSLAYMMATKNLHQNWYLAAVYFFLHFQYNGWFFFSCMGLLADKFKFSGMNMNFMKKVFWLFAAACIPAYFLSALWLPIPVPVYVLVVLSAMSQVLGGYLLFTHVNRQKALLRRYNATGNWLMWIAGASLAIKLLLQLGSTIPSLSDLAFGFRPIVIGYLHLVLLAVITLFILGYIISQRYIQLNRLVLWGTYTFTAGIVLNEIFLMIQGISGLSYESIPHMDKLLLVAGIIMFIGLLLLNISAKLSAANKEET